MTKIKLKEKVKATLTTLCISLVLLATAIHQTIAQTTVTVSGDINANTTWTNDKFYLLNGFVYVKSGAVLTIQKGTIIKGDKISKGTLIVERGGKITAVGTATQPIVFTSNESIGQRDYGDWGGVILCGKAPINAPGGEAVIEGGVGSYYGGTDANDNSGTLQYVRIEFAGIAFQPNSEINGLTMGGVGKGTTINHIQVSYSGDDSYEWFGGNVNCKYLIAFRGWDDDFDTDFGFSGKVQFAVGLRDPNIADQSGSNGFESDNDATGTTNTPFTSATFSNISIFGPKVNLSTTINGQFKRGAHLRRNTKLGIYNSIITGYPTGLLVDGSGAETNASNDQLQVRNTFIAGCTTNLEVVSGSTFDIVTWFNTSSYKNKTYTNNVDLLVHDAFNLSNPDFTPYAGSPLMAVGAADFSNSNLQNAFVDTTAKFVGAFGTSDWTTVWANWDPQNTDYNQLNTGICNLNSSEITAIISPNPANNQTALRFTLKNLGNVNVDIFDVAGKLVMNVINEKLQSGNHLVTVNVEMLQPGVYIAKITTEEGVKNLKMIIQ